MSSFVNKSLALGNLKEDPRGMGDKDLLQISQWASGDDSLEVEQDDGLKMLTLYCSGYSIQKICSLFPEYERGNVQYSRWLYRWDQERMDYLQELHESVKVRLINTKLKTLNYLFKQLDVRRIQDEVQMDKYLKDPETEEAPLTLIRNANDLKRIIESVQLIIEGKDVKTININTFVEAKRVDDLKAIDAEYRESILHGLLEGNIQVVDAEVEDE